MDQIGIPVGSLEAVHLRSTLARFVAADTEVYESEDEGLSDNVPVETYHSSGAGASTRVKRDIRKRKRSDKADDSKDKEKRQKAE